MSQTFDRSQLDGKDREQLTAIASALGLKSISRLKKADLVTAIVNAAQHSGRGSGNGAAETAEAPKPRKIRSTRAAGEDDLDSLAAEQNALDSGESTTDDMALIRPRRTPRPNGASSTSGGATDTATPPSAPASSAEPDRSFDRGFDRGDSGRVLDRAVDAGGEAKVAPTEHEPSSPSQPGQPWRDRGEEDAQGNRRRRRRRGRDRDREPGAGGGGGGGASATTASAPISRPEPRQQDDFAGEPIEIEGLLDLRDEGYGFLRATGYLPGRNDAYVSASQVRRFSLRKGDYVKGATRPPASNEKYPALMRVDTINEMTPDEARGRVRFEDLTPLFPDERLRLELADNPTENTGRIIDLISPIGKGQRGLVVSPPKAGKTTILKQIVYAIERNNPEVHLMVLLVDERPEEVTDMRRHVQRGEVVASTFDRPSDEHTQVAELTIDRAKRLVELGRDVVIVLDGITRLARAYNLAAPASGRIMSGGVDSSALYPPKKFFGAARNIEEGGSLTIIATALIETGSKMDEVIFEEFKGTGNMELRLDRRLAERRIYPAIDVEASSTRHEELLFDRMALQQVWKLRRVMNALEGGAGLELLIDKIRTTKSNDQFLSEIAKAPSGMA